MEFEAQRLYDAIVQTAVGPTVSVTHEAYNLSFVCKATLADQGPSSIVASSAIVR